MKKELLKPKIDVVFHTLFREENKRLIEGLIGDILGEKIRVITTDRDRHIAIKATNEKYGILDLRTELANGVKCNIEIQIVKQKYEIERILYYWANTYARQLLRGNKYEKLKKTISIIIIDHEIECMEGLESLNAKWHIRNDEKPENVLTNRLEIVIIEIEKAKRIYKEHPENKIAQWMMFLDNPNNKEVEKIMKVNMTIRAAIEDLGAICGNKRMQRLAELREKGRRDTYAQMQYATEEGRKRGKILGKEEGRKEGRKEEKLRIAKILLEQKVAIGKIEKATGLTKEEIEKIQKTQ